MFRVLIGPVDGGFVESAQPKAALRGSALINNLSPFKAE
jgi:hypothetical protein